MQFEVTKEYIDQLKEAISSGRDTYIQDQLKELHPADIAEILNHIRDSEANYLFRLLEGEKAADVLVELDEDVRESLLSTLTSVQIAEQVIDNIDSDDAATVLSELSEEKISEVISHLKDREAASDIQDLLNYHDKTAGGIMGKELVKVRADWTIARGIREMRKQAEEVDEVYTIYVVDNEDRLLGTLSLKHLLFSSSSIKTNIGEIYSDKQLKYIHAEENVEEAASMMEKYDLVALPVVGLDMKLLGRITIDDVVDVIREEAERDYELASGISASVESTDTIFEITRARLPWLIIGLAGGITSAQIIGIFEEELSRVTTLMFFVPLIAAMGGNVGVQSSAIVVKGLANNTMDSSDIAAKLWKELSVALINGIICGGLILGFNLLFAGSTSLSLTVSLSLFSVIIFASLFGTLIPLVLNKFNVDPAVATGPFITTLNDIIGLTIYFSIAKMFFSVL